MSRKFAWGLGGVILYLTFMILARASAGAQQTTPSTQDPQSQQQQPQSQQSPQTPESQQPSEEIGMRKPKPKEYTNWSFNVGGGASLTNGNTANFVRGGGGIAAAGVARNYSKYFGFRLDFQFDNLPLKQSALKEAQAPGGNEHVYSLMLSPIVNLQVTKVWGGYVIGGPAFFHRSGKLDSTTAIPGNACNAFYLWWGHCFNNSLPINGQFLHSSLNQFGESFGGGITRKIRPNMDIYAEFRYLHGTHAGITTDLRPITIGLRW